jgi:hypothetical protein
MDELDLLRSAWKNNEQKFSKIPRNELYEMYHKKSSSVVKWIFIVSILEIVFWLSMTIFGSSGGGEDEGTKVIDNLNIDAYFYAMSVISYVILIFFCYRIYKAYIRLKITDNAKKLMADILNVRKTVSLYIYFNIGFLIISLGFIFYRFFVTDPGMIDLFNKAEAKGKMFVITLMVVVVTVVVIGFLSLLAWLIYKIVYGFFLKKLHRNYEELKKIERDMHE